MVDVEKEEERSPSFLEDLSHAVGELSKPSLVLAALIGLIASSYTLVWHPSYRRKSGVEHVLREVPSAASQRDTRDEWLRAISTVEIEGRSVELCSHRVGGTRPPRDLYDSVSFGVWNNVTNVTADAVRPWHVRFPDGRDFNGSLVQFKLDRLGDVPMSAREKAHLELTGLSTGTHLPVYHRQQKLVERAAIEAGQQVLVIFSPNHFAEPHPEDDLKHVHILKTIHPLRTGYQNLRATTTVWASSSNTTTTTRNASM